MGLCKTELGLIGMQIRFAVLLFACLFAGLFALTGESTVSAATTLPTKMNFQGRLTNSAGNILSNGTYNMRFRIWNASSGGVQQWSEDRLVSASQGVTVTNGQFSVQLGSVTSLPASVFTSNSLYFEVELPTPATATTTSPSWTEGAMTPRNQLATSAYAYNAETLDGMDSEAFSRLGSNNVYTGTNEFSSTTQFSNQATFTSLSEFFGTTVVKGTNRTDAFQVQKSDATTRLFGVDSLNDRVVIGASTADATGTVLVLDTKNTAGDPTGVSGAMYFNSSLNEFRCYDNNAWWPCRSNVTANTSVPAGNTFTNTNAEGIFASNAVIPANECRTGKVYRVTASGTYGTNGLSAPTLALRLKFGSVNIIATPANATSTGATGRQWTLRASVVCQTAPSTTATVEGQGEINRYTSAINNVPWEFQSTAPVTVNTTVAQTIQISAQFGTANASNTITLRQFIVEELSP